MTQLIVVNDTGNQIAANTHQELDGVFAGNPIAEIISASLINLWDGTTNSTGANTLRASPTAFVATATHGTGDYVYLNPTGTGIKLGRTFDVYQILLLNVRLEGEKVCPTVQ